MGDPFFDTIIAPATIAGTGAVSLIRISGPDSLKVGATLVQLRHGSMSDSPAGRVHFGVIHDKTAVLDEVICYSFHAPHSYTGEDSIEISCHASSYIVNRVIEMACELGCRPAGPGEFTRRAFLNGKLDLAQAEAVADLIASDSQAEHRVAMSQLRGGISSEMRELRGKLLEMTALMELELDFSEEDVEFADRTRLRQILEQTIQKTDKLISSFKLGNALKNGVPVAIVGATNSGKSTLLNSILGEQRAIVSEIEGTTRDTVEECFNAAGVLFRFIDTAGIRFHTADKVEMMGIERSLESMKKAQIVLLVIDLSCGIEEELLQKILLNVNKDNQKVIAVFNKTDLETDTGRINELVAKVETEDYVLISAKTGRGIPELIEKIASYVADARSSIGSDSVLVTNARHLQALTTARTSLLEVRRSLTTGIPTDLLTEDLHSALTSLGSITGEISSDEVLGEIFSKFCIGK